MRAEKIAEQPCPRCGCWGAMEFECGCGAIHGDVCINCGRFRNLADGEHIELGPVDARCDRGPELHEHDDRDKAERIAMWTGSRN